MHYRRRFYKNLLEGHELGLPNPEKINVLDAINCTVSTWTTSVPQVSIANCFRHCKIRSNEEISSDSSETNFEESLHELENMIKDVGYRNEMDVNKLVDYPGENDECSMVQSLEKIVADIIKDTTNDEVGDDSILLEPVTRKETLSATTTLHNFLLQLENSSPEHLAAIKKVRHEIQLDLNFKKNQVTIDSYFSKLP
ncbi:hypothetical protein Sango_0600800 [Sesamum angolense]|uniref:DDE-1 domain-containing protein n=1 Tax=Sesamum angolense TaxID=2727404 RepID=A0AAE1X701_9LAMI|nr:hypothetical protein Sango_0600800 [Sesamum angolense]